MFVTKLKMAALALFIVGLLAAGGVLTQHARTAAPQPGADPKIEDKKPTVRVVRPTPGKLGVRRAGHVRAAAEMQVYAAISGYLKEQAVDIGSAVKKGDTLAVIDAPLLLVEVKQAAAAFALEEGRFQEAKARVVTAEAELKAAEDRIKVAQAKLKSDESHLKFRKKQAERYAALLANRSVDANVVDEQEDRYAAALEAVNAAKEVLTVARSDISVKQSKIVSAKSALESAKASLDVAKFALEKAQILAGFTRIVAPFDGVVTKRNYHVGAYISSSDRGADRPLLTIQATDPLRVVADVAESEVPFTRPGMPVDLDCAALPGVKLAAQKIARTAFAVDEDTHAMRVEIDVANPKGLLRPGMSISVLLRRDEKAPPNAFIVPESCIVGPQGGASVYIVRDGKAHLTPVRVGLIIDRKAEIVAGVRAGDHLVIDPKGLSGDTVPVEIRKEP
jgi:RND family efflux transporter MFP subunit